MEEKESDGADVLLPGLPDEVVLINVITRLPWYARPVCRAVSKAWRSWIDTYSKRPDILLTSRQHLLPLLQARFLVNFIHRIFISEACDGRHEDRRSGFHCGRWWDKSYKICSRQWRELPSLQGFFPETLLAKDGMVYAWERPEPQSFVWKMDLAAGDWTWKKLTVPSCCYSCAVCFNGKIYVPSFSEERNSATDEEGEMMIVHDMTTEECELVKTWNYDNLRVLHNKRSESSSGVCEEELCSFIEHKAGSESGLNLEILVYNACNDSWTNKTLLPIPECKWSHVSEINLVNGDCFEPAPDGGINIVWIDSEGQVLSWFNSSLRETWVDFGCSAIPVGKDLEYLAFKHGCLYGFFVEYKKGRANKQDFSPFKRKRTIMKGKLVVRTSNVRWEEVLDVSCFEAPHIVGPVMVSSFEYFTLMT